MDYEIKLDETTAALRRIPFFLPDSADGYTPQTGKSGSLSGFQSKVGASAVALAGSFSEIDQSDMPGLYYYEATAGEVDTQGWMIFTFVCANCITQREHVRVGMTMKALDDNFDDAKGVGFSTNTDSLRKLRNKMDGT